MRVELGNLRNRRRTLPQNQRGADLDDIDQIGHFADQSHCLGQIGNVYSQL